MIWGFFFSALAPYLIRRIGTNFLLQGRGLQPNYVRCIVLTWRVGSCGFGLRPGFTLGGFARNTMRTMAFCLSTILGAELE